MSSYFDTDVIRFKRTSGDGSRTSEAAASPNSSTDPAAGDSADTATAEIVNTYWRAVDQAVASLAALRITRANFDKRLSIQSRTSP